MTQQPRFSDLSESELAWVADLTAHAQGMGASVEDPASIGALYDQALDSVVSGAQSPEIGNNVVNMVAAILGEHLRAACGAEWQVVEDEFGTDMCLKAPDSDWVLFPQSSVAKRWVAEERGWIVPFCNWAVEARTNPPSHDG